MAMPQDRVLSPFPNLARFGGGPDGSVRLKSDRNQEIPSILVRLKSDRPGPSGATDAGFRGRIKWGRATGPPPGSAAGGGDEYRRRVPNSGAPHGQRHEFHFRVHLLGDRVALDAFELRDEEPRGYHFQIIGDPQGDLFALMGQLVERMRRALALRHLKYDKQFGWTIADFVVRSSITGDDEQKRPRTSAHDRWT